MPGPHPISAVCPGIHQPWVALTAWLHGHALVPTRCMCACFPGGDPVQDEAGLWGNSNATLLNVYSALHDVLKGEVRVFIELFPEELCPSIVTCAFPGSDVAEVPAAPDLPFPKLLGEGEPEPRECLVTCALPAKHHSANVSEMVLIDKHGYRPVSRPVERLRVLKQKKGLGMCVGPVFTDTPQWLVRPAAFASCMLSCKHACVSGTSGPCCPPLHGAPHACTCERAACTKRLTVSAHKTPVQLSCWMSCRPWLHACGSTSTDPALGRG